jgi:hypothetical protein
MMQSFFSVKRWSPNLIIKYADNLYSTRNQVVTEDQKITTLCLGIFGIIMSLTSKALVFGSINLAFAPAVMCIAALIIKIWHHTTYKNRLNEEFDKDLTVAKGLVKDPKAILQQLDLSIQKLNAWVEIREVVYNKPCTELSDSIIKGSKKELESLVLFFDGNFSPLDGFDEDPQSIENGEA